MFEFLQPASSKSLGEIFPVPSQQTLSKAATEETGAVASNQPVPPQRTKKKDIVEEPSQPVITGDIEPISPCSIPTVVPPCRSKKNSNLAEESMKKNSQIESVSVVSNVSEADISESVIRAKQADSVDHKDIRPTLSERSPAKTEEDSVAKIIALSAVDLPAPVPRGKKRLSGSFGYDNPDAAVETKTKMSTDETAGSTSKKQPQLVSVSPLQLIPQPRKRKEEKRKDSVPSKDILSQAGSQSTDELLANKVHLTEDFKATCTELEKQKEKKNQLTSLKADLSNSERVTETTMDAQIDEELKDKLQPKQTDNEIKAAQEASSQVKRTDLLAPKPRMRKQTSGSFNANIPSISASPPSQSGAADREILQENYDLNLPVPLPRVKKRLSGSFTEEVAVCDKEQKDTSLILDGGEKEIDHPVPVPRSKKNLSACLKDDSPPGDSQVSSLVDPAESITPDSSESLLVCSQPFSKDSSPVFVQKHKESFDSHLDTKKKVIVHPDISSSSHEDSTQVFEEAVKHTTEEAAKAVNTIIVAQNSGDIKDKEERSNQKNQDIEINKKEEGEEKVPLDSVTLDESAVALDLIR